MSEKQENTTDSQPPVEVEEGEALGGQELAPVDNNQSPTRRFTRSGPKFDLSILDKAITSDNRFDLAPKRDLLVSLVGSLTEDKRRKRIVEVRETFDKTRVIDATALDEAVADAPDDVDTKKVRNKIRQTIKSLPEK